MIAARIDRWSVGYAKPATGRWRGAVAVAALVAVLATALPLRMPDAFLAHGRIAPPPSAALPAALAPQVNGTLATDAPAYTVAAAPGDSGTLRAANPAQHFAVTFAPDGVRVAADRAQWGLRLVAVGDGEAVTPIVATPDARGNRVAYRRGAVTEWYENGPLGLEQGFTLASPVAGRSGTRTLTLSFTGDATPTQEGDAVMLALPGGALRYGDLRAVDATGRVLPSRMVLDGKTLRLVAEDAGAVYPVTVDPLVQQSELTASDGVANDFFAMSVAANGSGASQVFVVGAVGKRVGGNAGQGAAYVFTPNGVGGYSQQRLIASDGAAGDSFGLAVAVSGSGAATTIVVGAFAKTLTDHHEQGEAYVYTPNGGGYSEQRLFAGDGATMDQFGAGVAVSGSGAGVAALIGAVDKTIGGHAFQGALYLFIPGSPSPLPSPRPTVAPAPGGPPNPCRRPGDDPAAINPCGKSGSAGFPACERTGWKPATTGLLPRTAYDPIEKRRM